MRPPLKPPKAKRPERLVPPLATDQERFALLARWDHEDIEDLQRLANDMGISEGPDRWYWLALALARKHEPEFKFQKTQRKWLEHRCMMLVVEIERLTGDERLTGKRSENPSRTAAWAAGVLAKRKEWSDFLNSPTNPAEALRVKYSKFHKTGFAVVARKAFKWHELNDDVAGWESEVRHALRPD
jgi:hypothetical protein